MMGPSNGKPVVPLPQDLTPHREKPMIHPQPEATSLGTWKELLG